MKLSNLTYGFLALMVAVISTNAQERSRGERERGGRDAQWAREAMERYRGSGRVNPLDPEAVKRRMDYAVKEGLMTREQADQMMIDAKKRMEVVQREDNDRRGRGGNNERRGREAQSNDRQADARKGYEIRRKRIEEGVKSGKIKREDAAKMYADLRKRMEAANRGSGDEPRTDQRRGDDRGRVDMEAIRKRVEEGVKSGRIKREDAGRIIEGIRKRMEAANRDGSDKKEEGKEDPRLARYRATERELAAAVKAGKLSKEDAAKKLVVVRKQLWGSGDKSNDSNRKRTGDIVDVAAGNKSFRTLVAAVKAAGLVDTLKGKGPYTVFAPTDEAFAKLPKGTLQSLLKPENKKKLVAILTYHVVPGKVLSKNVKSGRVKTANGSSFEIKVSKGRVTVNQAKVVATDVMASNGVIHVIDTVIIPQSGSSARSSQAKSSQSRGSSRGYLGVAVESSSRPKGLRVQQVYANTAAARAKLKKGDFILKMNGATVSSNSSLIGRLSKTKPGQKATLLVSSGGKTKTVQVQLGGSYSTSSSAPNDSSRSRSSSPSRSSQAKNSQSRDSSRSRTPQRSSGTDWRKAIEERMKKAREDRERAERNSRGRGDDRGEDMRKAMEERMKQWRESRERDGGRDGRRPEAQRGPQGRGPQPGGSWRGGPGGRGPQPGGSWRGGPGGRGPQSGGPGRGGPRGR